jgi:hypothetical protein
MTLTSTNQTPTAIFSQRGGLRRRETLQEVHG